MEQHGNTPKKYRTTKPTAETGRNTSIKRMQVECVGTEGDEKGWLRTVITHSELPNAPSVEHDCQHLMHGKGFRLITFRWSRSIDCDRLDQKSIKFAPSQFPRVHQMYSEESVLNALQVSPWSAMRLVAPVDQGVTLINYASAFHKF